MEQTKTCISTRTRFFDFTKPEEFQYDIEEIAHALSNLCRYTGHVNSFYSVAEHSFLVSHLVPEKYALEGLLHDASEAFCGDVAKPLKEMLPEYKTIEDRVQEAVATYFNLQYPFPEEVHKADAQMYWTERKSIAASDVVDTLWNKGTGAVRRVEPFGWTPEEAKGMFLVRYKELTDDRYSLVRAEREKESKAA